MNKFHLSSYSLLLFILMIDCKEQKYNHTSKENNLYFVFSSFRHGARKPLVKIDVFKNIIKSPGKLTSFGIKQHFIIGKKNRERYFNFLDLGNKTFNSDQIYIRSSNIKRAFLSTKMQLKGLLNSQKYYDIIHPIKIKDHPFILYNLNITKNLDIFTYYKNCFYLRKLEVVKTNSKYQDKFNNIILPLLEKCIGKTKIKSLHSFCDQVFCSYYEYVYISNKVNEISKCDYNIIKKINNFCVNYYDTIRGWNEKNAYYFYSFFTILLKYMKKSIEGIGKLKMIMIGGHDYSVDILMNFLSGINIVKRTEYPHFAFNILFELRKYNNENYIEIYYNDKLKYNKTMKEYKNKLDNTKYSHFKNYCINFGFNKNRINMYKKFKKHTIQIIIHIIIIFSVFMIIIRRFFLFIKRKYLNLSAT